MIYQWKEGRAFALDAQVVGEHLDHLRLHGGGSLTPRTVVEDARSASSPIHSAFEWDDPAAAERWRETQARELIRSVVVRMPEQPAEARPVRAFVSLPVEGGRSYTTTVVAMRDANLRQHIVEQALAEVRGWHARYRDLHELAAIFGEVERFKLVA